MTFQQAFQAVGQAEDRIFRGSGRNLLSQEPTAAACSAYISRIKHYQVILVVVSFRKMDCRKHRFFGTREVSIISPLGHCYEIGLLNVLNNHFLSAVEQEQNCSTKIAVENLL